MERNIGTSAITIVTLLALWELLINLNESFVFYVSKPSLIFAYTYRGIVDGFLLKHIYWSGLEIILGLFFGILAGLILACLLWYFELLQKMLLPILFVVSIVPVFVLAPLIVIWLGIGVSMKIILAAFAVAMIILSQVLQGMNSIPDGQYKALKVYGASRFQIMQKILLPGSKQWVQAGIHYSISFAVLGVFIGEFISANKGIAAFMLKQGALYNVTAVFSGAFSIVILCVVIHYISLNFLNLQQRD